jgi:hypothetical protein
LRARATASATPRGGGAATPHARRRTLALVVGFAALVIAVAIALVVTSGGGGSPAASSAGTTAGHTTGSRAHGGSAAAPPHDKTTVAVLNGTTVAGLANTVANQLASDGFVRGSVSNASSQNRTATFVSYLGGHEREAAEVARALGLSADAVGPIDPDTETACANGGAACNADIVVTVAADRQ